MPLPTIKIRPGHLHVDDNDARKEMAKCLRYMADLIEYRVGSTEGGLVALQPSENVFTIKGDLTIRVNKQ